MVRYFGFLANRVCWEKLPQVYQTQEMDKPTPVAKACYTQMSKQFLRRDPFECVLGVRWSDGLPLRDSGPECVGFENLSAEYQSDEVYPG